MFKTHFKQTETFHCIHFSSCHPISMKKGFNKGESLLLLRINSVKDNFESLESYILHLIYLTELSLGSSLTKLLQKFKKSFHQEKWLYNLQPFVTIYDLVTLNLKKIVMKHWHLNGNLAKICFSGTDCRLNTFLAERKVLHYPNKHKWSYICSKEGDNITNFKIC